MLVSCSTTVLAWTLTPLSGADPWADILDPLGLSRSPGMYLMPGARATPAASHCPAPGLGRWDEPALLTLWGSCLTPVPQGSNQPSALMLVLLPKEKQNNKKLPLKTLKEERNWEQNVNAG